MMIMIKMVSQYLILRRNVYINPSRELIQSLASQRSWRHLKR